MLRIDTKRGRDSLPARREPYWYKLSKGRYLGLRKLADGHCTWVARARNEQGGQDYCALGECSEALGFDQAKELSEAWAKDIDRGIRNRDEEGGVATVASACAAYVRSLRAEGREATAQDAHMRFRRTVYGETLDAALAQSPPKRVHKPKPTTHPLATTPLTKVRGHRLREWLVGLTAAGVTRMSANRTLSSLKAALNLAVRNRMVGAAVAQEWTEVTPLKGTARRRDLFLDLGQRRALLAAARGAFADLIAAAMLTGCRAGELTLARRSAFDARTASLSVTGKTGARVVPLAPVAVELFVRLSKDKLPTAFLLTRDDGRPWAHSDWDELVKEAAAAAKLPDKTCLYTLRHSFITQVLLDGMSTLEVSKMVGTSLAMIEKHYGHLVHSTARERLALVQLA